MAENKAPISLYTIGYGNRRYPEFSKILVENDIKVLVDVRREGSKAWAQVFRQGYRHMADRLLRIRPHDRAIWYVAAPEFGNHFKDVHGEKSLSIYYEWLRTETREKLVQSWVSIVDAYMHLGWNPCLMCAEKEAIKDGEVNCHRVLVADRLKECLLYYTGYEYSVIHI